MEENILREIFLEREQNFLCELSDEEKKAKREIKRIGNEEKLRELINQINNQYLKKRILKYLDLSFEDISKYECVSLEKYYVQGFKDGSTLVIKCIS